MWIPKFVLNYLIVQVEYRWKKDWKYGKALKYSKELYKTPLSVALPNQSYVRMLLNIHNLHALEDNNSP